MNNMPLPALLAYAPAAVSGISSLASYFSGRKNRTPRFGNTDYGRHLQQIGQEGIYSPDAQRGLLTRRASQSGNIAQKRKSSLSGYLESIGMGNSIAGARLLAEPGQEHQHIMSDYTSQLGETNEMSKRNALAEYARQSNQYGAQRQAEGANLRSNLIGGLGGAVASGLGTGYQQYMGNKLAGYGAPEGKQYGPFAQYVLAAQAGIQLPYGAGRETQSSIPMPDITGMSKEDAMQAILFWFSQGGGQ